MTTPPKDAIREKAETAESAIKALVLEYGTEHVECCWPRIGVTDIIDSALRSAIAEEHPVCEMIHVELERKIKEKDEEIAELKSKLHQLKINLILMHFAGMKVTCCWYSPNVFDRNYSAGAIRGSATCDCQPCTDWRNSKERT